MIKIAYQAAKEAISGNKLQNCNLHKWYGIIIGEYYSEDYFQLLKSAEDIKYHFEESIKLSNADPTVMYCLGMWHFRFAALPEYQRRLFQFYINFIKAESFVIPRSTYETALNVFLRAEHCKPNFFPQSSDDR